MKYLAGIGLPLLFQALFTGLAIAASPGGGSFAGLGEMLFGVMGIPTTALVNWLLILSASNAQRPFPAGRIVFITFLLPVVQLALLLLGHFLRL